MINEERQTVAETEFKVVLLALVFAVYEHMRIIAKKWTIY
jgi:hypothetical protein